MMRFPIRRLRLIAAGGVLLQFTQCTSTINPFFFDSIASGLANEAVELIVGAILDPA